MYGMLHKIIDRNGRSGGETVGSVAEQLVRSGVSLTMWTVRVLDILAKSRNFT